MALEKVTYGVCRIHGIILVMDEEKKPMLQVHVILMSWIYGGGLIPNLRGNDKTETLFIRTHMLRISELGFAGGLSTGVSVLSKERLFRDTERFDTQT